MLQSGHQGKLALVPQEVETKMGLTVQEFTGKMPMGKKIGRGPGTLEEHSAP